MEKLSFCSCPDHKCPLNPVNHDRGCNLCVQKCLNADEVPSCFFRKVSPNLENHHDWTFSGFADLVNENK